MSAAVMRDVASVFSAFGTQGIETLHRRRQSSARKVLRARRCFRRGSLAPHRTAPHRTAPHRTDEQFEAQAYALRDHHDLLRLGIEHAQLLHATIGTLLLYDGVSPSAL